MPEEKKELASGSVSTTDTCGGFGNGGSGEDPSDKHTHMEYQPLWVRREIAKHLSVKELGQLALFSKANHAFFGLHRDLLRTLEAVVEGNPRTVMVLVQRKPELFFTKFNVKDPAGQLFEEVSPFQLMIFLADDKMLETILSTEAIHTLITQELEAEANSKALIEACIARGDDVSHIRFEKSRYSEQIETLTGGGADIVNINFDPMSRPFEAIESITLLEALYSHTTYGGALYDALDDEVSPLPKIRFPLLESPDGILCYKNRTPDEVKWYYADRETRRIREITSDAMMLTINAITTEDERTKVIEAFNQFKQSCIDMVSNSARRSSIQEHALIRKVLCSSMKAQKGIEYTSVEGVRYRDTRFPFNVYYNKARHCIELYDGIDRLGFYLSDPFDAADKAWIEVGNELKKLIWRLQYLCQQSLSFSPLKIDFLNSINQRELKLLLPDPDRKIVVDVFSRSLGFHAGLGSKFSIFKGCVSRSHTWTGARCIPSLRLCSAKNREDIVALTGLVEEAKRYILKIIKRPEPKPSMDFKTMG